MVFLGGCVFLIAIHFIRIEVLSLLSSLLIELDLYDQVANSDGGAFMLIPISFFDAVLLVFGCFMLFPIIIHQIRFQTGVKAVQFDLFRMFRCWLKILPILFLIILGEFLLRLASLSDEMSGVFSLLGHWQMGFTDEILVLLVEILVLSYLFGSFCLAPVILVLEEVAIRKALTRSWQLTAGHRLKLMASFLPIYILGKLGIVLQGYFGSGAVWDSYWIDHLLWTFSVYLAFSLQFGFLAVLMSVVYQRLVKGGEFSPKELSAFD